MGDPLKNHDNHFNHSSDILNEQRSSLAPFASSSWYLDLAHQKLREHRVTSLPLRFLFYVLSMNLTLALFAVQELIKNLTNRVLFA